MSYKFKRGDQVRITCEGNCSNTVIEEYGLGKGDIVYVIQDDSDCPHISNNKEQTYMDADDTPFVDQNHLELVEEDTQDYVKLHRKLANDLIESMRLHSRPRWVSYDDLQETNNRSIMTTITTFAKKVLSADVRTLIKAGYLDRDLEITSEGQSELMAIVLQEHKDKLVAVAEEKLSEDKD